MAISREKKTEILDGLKKVVKESKSIVFVNFRGVSVSDVSNLRRDLRKEFVGYQVAKKTLLNLALDSKEIGGERPDLKGEVALAYLDSSEEGSDVLAPARKVFEFQKKLDDKVKIVGGIFDGKYLSLGEMTDIANIPPLSVLRGMFVNIINAPIQRLVVSLGEIAKVKN